MKISISSRQLFVLGFALLLITNVLVLAGVIYNRSGEPDAQISLTERELTISHYNRKENSGLALWVVWRVLGKQITDRHLYYSRPIQVSGYGSNAEWLDSNKLEMLGFDTDLMLQNIDIPKQRKITVPREVYLVLEYDGDSYREAVSRTQAALAKVQDELAARPKDETLQKRVKNAKRWLAFERVEASRLFAVDAGLDPDLLRQQYSDRNHHIIAKGLVTSGYVRGNRKNPDIFGRIKRISINSIQVPLQFRNTFDAVMVPRTVRTDDPPIPPRYAVDLAYGSRLEPWIKTVRKLR